MRSTNPVLTRSTTSPYSARATTDRLVTLDAVITRTTVLFLILLASAATVFALAPGPLLTLSAALVGLVLGIWITVSATIRPAAIMVYAAVEGMVVGGISHMYADAFSPGLIPQAVLGTMAAFTAMLFAYKSGVIRATPKFRKTLIIAAIGYMVFGLLHFLGVLIGAWDSIYFGEGANLLGVGVSLLGTALAALFLVLDFDHIEQSIRRGAPETYAWRLAFGLIVTVVWLYLEMLRLLSIIQGRD
jgi:uncharacterized YccA/Bax inhibitor family protein